MTHIELEGGTGLRGVAAEPRKPRLAKRNADDLFELAQVVLRLSDMAAAIALAWLAQILSGRMSVADPLMVASIAAALGVCLLSGQWQGTYLVSELLEKYGQLLKAAITAAAIAAVELIVTERGTAAWSTVSFILLAGAGLAGLIGPRLLSWHRVSRRLQAGQLVKRIAIVTPDGRADDLVRLLKDKGRPYPLEIVGIFRPDHALDASLAADSITALAMLARNGEVDEVLLTGSWRDPTMLMKAADQFSWFPITVALCPEVPEPYRTRPILALPGEVPALAVFKRPLTAWQARLKRAEDLALVAPILLLFSLLMLLCALAIKLDSAGPVLYRQRRYGFNHESITVYKFRTMRDDAQSNAHFVQATRGDPRVTRVGRFLRRTSLDELPQLLNVLEGSMSLVGPRPHPIPLDEAFAPMISHYFVRNRVKPGITGWAQINGLRGETNTPDKMAKRVELDKFYVENWSIFFDLGILARTALFGFVHPNAY